MSKTHLTLRERFLSHVSIPENLDGCWEWVGSKNNSGYGQFSIKHKPHKAHRVSFELFVRSIPENLFVCHSCDNKLCVNPTHLFLGTAQDNMTDRNNKNRQSHHTKMRGENHGLHKLTEQEIYQIRELRKNNYTLQEIADLFGINNATVYRIAANQSWKWLK